MTVHHSKSLQEAARSAVAAEPERHRNAVSLGFEAENIDYGRPAVRRQNHEISGRCQHRQYQRALESLNEYKKTLEMGLQIVLKDRDIDLQFRKPSP